MSIQQFIRESFLIDSHLSENQIIAIRNLMLLAIERVWIGKAYPDTPKDLDDMTVDIDNNEINIIKDSFSTCEQLLEDLGHPISDDTKKSAIDMFKTSDDLLKPILSK